MFDLGLADVLGAFIGLVFTLFVFSYIFGDNVLFRITIHVFIGVAAGYTLAVAVSNVIWPQLIVPLLAGGYQNILLLLIPLGLSLLLFTKVSERFSILGTPVMAYLVGVGAATIIGGAVFGTLFPQALAAMNVFDPQSIFRGGSALAGIGKIGNAGLMLVGTVSTLAYFQFSSRAQRSGRSERPLWLQIISWIGQAFIAVTFGAIFAGVYAAAMMAMVERWNSLVQLIFSLLSP